MKLYSGPLSLFTAKVRIALDEKGIDAERVEVGWSLEDRYQPHHPLWIEDWAWHVTCEAEGHACACVCVLAAPLPARRL
jgi:hypothetical protein